MGCRKQVFSPEAIYAGGFGECFPKEVAEILGVQTHGEFTAPDSGCALKAMHTRLPLLTVGIVMGPDNLKYSCLLMVVKSKCASNLQTVSQAD